MYFSYHNCLILLLICVLILGETISEKDRCKECKGKKVVQDTKVLEVNIDKGMKDGQKIPFRGEGHQQVCICFTGVAQRPFRSQLNSLIVLTLQQMYHNWPIHVYTILET